MERESVLKENTGLGEKETSSCDYDVVKKYYKKYSFFVLHTELKELHELNRKFKNVENTYDKHFVRCIWDENYILEKRYDLESIKSRMVIQLKDIDKVSPGTYHEGAEITDFKVRTEDIMSFPKINEMVESFISMYRRMESLFFQILNETINPKDIEEYNFLVGWFEAKDAYASDVLFTYDNVIIYKQVYLEEGFCDLFKYVRIARKLSVPPWKCIEFYEDLDLVQQYTHIYPETKSRIHEYGMELINFYCEFIWSDAKTFLASEDEIEEMKMYLDCAVDADWEAMKQFEHVEKESIYIAKNVDELDGVDLIKDKIKKITSPESLGGIVTRSRDHMNPITEAIPRMDRRLQVKRGGQ